MQISVNCGSCKTKLSVKAEHAGKQVRCIRCGQLVRVTVAPVVVGSPNRHAAPVMAELVNDDQYVQVTTPVQVQVIPAARPLPPKPIRAASPPMSNFEVLPQDTPATSNGSYDPPSGPQLKKKKKKKSKKLEETSVPPWMWIVGGLGALVTISGVIIGLWMMLKMNNGGEKPINWAFVAVHFGIGVPISLVILVVSMFVSSALGGGIDFGEAKTAIIGGLFLVIIVNLVELIPGAGFYLTFPVWLIGFMAIFGLDPWEARFLLFINWVFNYIIGMFVIAAILSGRFEAPEREIQIAPEMPDVLPERNGIEMPPGFEEERRPPPNRKKDRGKVPPNQPDIDDDWSYVDDLHHRLHAWVAQQGRRPACA
jgi:hypothetical protein